MDEDIYRVGLLCNNCRQTIGVDIPRGVSVLHFLHNQPKSLICSVCDCSDFNKQTWYERDLI